MLASFPTTSLGDTDYYQNLFDFFGNCRFSLKNTQSLEKYFSQEFLKYPDKFSEFLNFFFEKIQKMPPEKQIEFAQKYLFSLSVLCERFGVFELKNQMDDYAFRISLPEEYLKLSSSIEKYKKNSQAIIEQIFTIFEGILKKHRISGKIEGRYKNIYSIYKKLKKLEDTNILKLNDIFAFRFILKGSKENCYEILNILHDTFTPLPSRFKDYISIPKVNGYQSIHTGILDVLMDLDMPIEVQIRTESMHEIAESGIAAHFLYAREKKAKIIDEKEKKLLTHFQALSSFSREESLYCFTPAGDIIKVPYGSTSLDFAEKIHSKLRKQAKYCLINGRKLPLDYKICSGEVIEIIV